MPWRFQDSSWLNFYAVAVSRLFLAKFYAVEVEHQLNNISNSATLTNFFNSTASTQPTSTQQHQLNQLQLNSINSTNFNSTASTQPTTSTQQHLHSTTTSTQQHQLNQLLQLSNIFIQQQLQLNNRGFSSIAHWMIINNK
uniref:Uncharacterized protein n=1 Tax=Meloidogyne incognita TaxID=6306 RepID=A0A914LPM3_MELIC